MAGITKEERERRRLAAESAGGASMESETQKPETSESETLESETQKPETSESENPVVYESQNDQTDQEPEPQKPEPEPEPQKPEPEPQKPEPEPEPTNPEVLREQALRSREFFVHSSHA